MGLIAPESPLLLDLDYANLSADQQALVDALIEAASTRIERYCNRIFAAADYVEYHSGTGHNQIFVENPPINSLDSIDFIVGSTTTSVDDEEFTYNSKQGEIRWKDININATSIEFLGTFFQGYNNIVIRYNGGWSTVPLDIQEVCAQAVKELFDPTLMSGDMQKEKLGQYFYDRGNNYIDKSLMSHKKIMSSYKIRSYGFEQDDAIQSYL